MFVASDIQERKAAAALKHWHVRKLLSGHCECVLRNALISFLITGDKAMAPTCVPSIMYVSDRSKAAPYALQSTGPASPTERPCNASQRGANRTTGVGQGHNPCSASTGLVAAGQGCGNDQVGSVLTKQGPGCHRDSVQGGSIHP